MTLKFRNVLTKSFLAFRWADTIAAEGQDGQVRKFSHPFVQAVSMFVGEMLCLLAFKVMFFWFRRRQDGSENEHELTKGNRQFNPFIFVVPALCDMTATSIMYIGLNLTYPSSFQVRSLKWCLSWVIITSPSSYRFSEDLSSCLWASSVWASLIECWLSENGPESASSSSDWLL